jgi:hypothetical protein
MFAPNEFRDLSCARKTRGEERENEKRAWMRVGHRRGPRQGREREASRHADQTFSAFLLPQRCPYFLLFALVAPPAQTHTQTRKQTQTDKHPQRHTIVVTRHGREVWDLREPKKQKWDQGRGRGRVGQRPQRDCSRWPYRQSCCCRFQWVAPSR